jgi:hypothetical protein
MQISSKLTFAGSVNNIESESQNTSRCAQLGWRCAAILGTSARVPMEITWLSVDVSSKEGIGKGDTSVAQRQEAGRGSCNHGSERKRRI